MTTLKDKLDKLAGEVDGFHETDCEVVAGAFGMPRRCDCQRERVAATLRQLAEEVGKVESDAHKWRTYTLESGRADLASRIIEADDGLTGSQFGGPLAVRTEKSHD